MNGFLPNNTAHAAGLRISHNNPNVFFRDYSFAEDPDVSYSSHDITREHVQTSREHAQNNRQQNHTETPSGGYVQTPNPAPRTGKPNLQELRELQVRNSSSTNHIGQNETRKHGIVRGRIVTRDMRNSTDRHIKVNNGLSAKVTSHGQHYPHIGKSYSCTPLLYITLSID